MKFIIEFDGVLTDVRSSYYEAHRRVAESLGWSRLDESTFWRTLRSKGRDGVYLRGARMGLADKHYPAFEQECEREEILAACEPMEGTVECLKHLSRHGTLMAVTMGPNVGARRALAERGGLIRHLEVLEGLDSNPRRRPGELTALSEGDRRAIIVASTDSLIRAAAQTELLKIGISTGVCSIRRLHQAGADLVYSELTALAESLDSGATDLIEAGLLPDVGRTL